MKNLVLAFAISIVVPSIASADYSWQSYEGHQYAVTQNYGIWVEAEAEAVAAGGHLATINDANENTWLADAFAGAYARGFPGHPWFNGAWIGYFQDSDSEWRWIDGEPVTFTSYYYLWPEGGVHAYLHLANHDSPYLWNANTPHDDISNPAYHLLGIIEVVPEPTTLGLLALGGLALLRGRFKATLRKGGSAMRTVTTAMLACVLMTGASQAAVYTGTLTGGGGGIYATDGWDSTLTAFTYSVTVPDGPGLVHYKYEFSAPVKAISHLIIEVSSNFTGEDIFPMVGDIDTFSAESQGGTNPGMPGPMYGIRFECGGGDLNSVIEFDSTRLPTWADFYSKDGSAPGDIDVYAYNDGFTIVDPPSDPMDPGYVPPSNTPYMNKILVPDTIPEPATLSLLGLGALGMSGRRKR
jgi:hypothetical protein